MASALLVDTFAPSAVKVVEAVKPMLRRQEQPAPGAWTYDDYAALDDDQRYEVIEGELLMAAAPSSPHQWTSMQLGFQFNGYVKANQSGVVLAAPIDVILSKKNVVQPDLVFIANGNKSIIQHRGIVGAPDLAVEIISPGSVKRDREIKKRLYAQYGVKEYWLVDLTAASVEVLILADGQYETFALAAEKGTAESKLLPGFRVEVAEIIWNRPEK